jgi:hypothetical protein
MSDLAALEILASINKLASEIKSINISPVELPLWKQPWFGTLAGVFVGFSLNYLKDFFLQGNVKRNKIKCIKYEVTDIQRTCIDGMTYSMGFYNEYVKQEDARIQVQFTTEMVTKCFESFYADIVAYISHSQRDSLVKVYKHLDHLMDTRSKFLKAMEEKPLTNKQKEKYVYIMVDCYANIYFSAKCYLTKSELKQFKVHDIIKEMDVDSHGLDHLINQIDDD